MNNVVKVLGLLVYVACSLAAYPATYPFENEAFVPVGPPAATPSLSYDDEDEGGYIYYYYARASFDLTDEDFQSPTMFGEETDAAWSPTQTGAVRYLLVVQFSAPADLSADVWNCTGKNIVLAASDFTGKVNGQTVCAVGECCKGVYGMPKFGEDQLTWSSWLNDRAAAAMCGDIEEEMYCVAVGGDFQTNCFDYYLSPDSRLSTFICPDSYLMYYLTCPVFKQAYSTVYVQFESPVYLNRCTPEEQISSDAHYFTGDRVCHPYSYYHPSTESTSGADSSSGSDSTSTGSSSDSGSSAVSVFFSLLFLAF